MNQKDGKFIFWMIVAIMLGAILLTIVHPAKADTIDDIKKDMLGNSTQQKEIWKVVGGKIGWLGSLTKILALASIGIVVTLLIIRGAYGALSHDAAMRQEAVKGLLNLFIVVFAALFVMALIFYMFKNF